MVPAPRAPYTNYGETYCSAVGNLQREPGGFAFLFEGFTMGPNALHCFPGTPPATVGRLAFKTDESGCPGLRGLEFCAAEGKVVHPEPNREPPRHCRAWME